MALSQDEQRVLAEIERRLTADDPGLATCLTAFRRPGPATILHSPRARIVGSLFTVLLVAMVSLMVYAMIPFRAHGARPQTTSTSASTETAVSAATSGPNPVGAKVASGSSGAPAAGVSAGAVQRTQPEDQTAGHSASPPAGPLSRSRAALRLPATAG